MCLAGAVVASLVLTQEVAGFTVMTNILSLNSVKHLGKTPLMFRQRIINTFPLSIHDLQ